MFLSDIDIKKNLQLWKIRIDNFEEKRLNPCSYDICLWNKFIITDLHNSPFIDPDKKISPKTKEIIINDWEEFILHPWVSILWTSKDFFWSDDFLILLYWKSSLARVWLTVHNTAPIMNPWHYLYPIFELCNLNSVPLILRPGMKIAQILFWELSSKPERLYKDSWRYKDNNWVWWIPEK